MAKGQAQGYVFVIKDPRLTIQGKPDIVFVGNGRQPWESVARHLERSSNPEVAEWAESLHRDFPEGVEILGKIVAARWHGETKQIIPEPQPGITRVEWDIVDLEDEGPSRSNNQPGVQEGSQILLGGTKKAYWVKKLQAEGHPLLNKKVGRPQTRRPRRNIITTNI